MKITIKRKDQQGIVLFVSLVMVLILASLTVTTAQVTSQATKFAKTNDSSIRAELQQKSVVNDVHTSLLMMTGEVSPSQAGGGFATGGTGSLSVGSGETVVLPTYENNFAVFYAAKDALPPINAFDNFVKCGEGGTVNLDFGFVSPLTGSVASTPFPFSLAGNCWIDLRQRYINDVSAWMTNRPVSFYQATNNNMNTVWNLARWRDYESELCGNGAPCRSPGTIGQNNESLREAAQQSYATSVDSASSVTGSPAGGIEEVDFLNFSHLPEFMLETGVVRTASLDPTTYGGSRSDPIVYHNRITAAGYGGYIDEIDGAEVKRARSNYTVQQVVRIIGK